MGPLIDAARRGALPRTLDPAQAQGGGLLCGGRVLSARKFRRAGDRAARADMAVVQTETFAPILYLIAVATLEEAIAMQNAVPYGLSSARIHRAPAGRREVPLRRGQRCGIANINLGTSGAEIGGAFGGEKDTGGGREAGSDSWKAYMRRQTNTINWSSRCRSPRASASTSAELPREPRFDLGGALGKAHRRHRTQGFQFLGIERQPVLLHPPTECLQLRQVAPLRPHPCAEAGHP